LSDGASPATEIRNTIHNSSMTISSGTGNSVFLDQGFLTFSSTTTPFIATIGSTYDMGISSTNDLSLTSNNSMNLNSQVDFSVSATNNINLLTTGATGAVSIGAGAGAGIDLNSKGGYFNCGDTFAGFNKTTINLIDSSKQIFLNSVNGVVQFGDINGLGNSSTVLFDFGREYLTSNMGQMARTDEESVTILSTQVDVSCNFISTNVDLEFKAVINYFNPLAIVPRRDGWFCYIQNCSSGSINITSADAKQFIQSGNVLTISALPGFTTARYTLTYITNGPSGSNHYWSVMLG
jgi:hypothetical protein